jgi:hypothetical protein
MGLVGVVALSVGCNAVVRGSRLSSVPQNDGPQNQRELFLSTGGAPRKYRTLGFIQVRGYGQEWAGYGDIGNANLDGSIHNALAREAVRMGGQGVVNIEFLDENPSTDLERAQRAYNALTTFLGSGQVESRDRYVTVTGEVIVFLE